MIFNSTPGRNDPILPIFSNGLKPLVDLVYIGQSYDMIPIFIDLLGQVGAVFSMPLLPSAAFCRKKRSAQGRPGEFGMWPEGWVGEVLVGLATRGKVGKAPHHQGKQNGDMLDLP